MNPHDDSPAHCSFIRSSYLLLTCRYVLGTGVKQWTGQNLCLIGAHIIGKNTYKKSNNKDSDCKYHKEIKQCSWEENCSKDDFGDTWAEDTEKI